MTPESTGHLVERYADLLLQVGVNLQPGQDVLLTAEVEHVELARELTRQAYRQGARWVEVAYGDQHLRRALIDLAPEDALGHSPAGWLATLEDLGRRRGALIQLVDDGSPCVLAGADPVRAGRAQMIERGRLSKRLTLEERLCNWLVAGCATRSWAERVLGRPDVEELWRVLARTVRLDAEDPIAAWREHSARLAERARQLSERAFEGIRFTGPGTDLFVGLTPGSRWLGGGGQTSWGLDFIPNLPTEEVFTCPDKRLTQGVVTATQPLVLDGSLIEALCLRFEGGKAVEVTADRGAELVQQRMSLDADASRLGEVALVDSESRVGQVGRLFWSTLYDENAACHIAFGSGFPDLVPEAEWEAALSRSSIHTDFMIGGPEVQVFGLERGGKEVPLIRDNRFQL
ncbi:MAG: aminopeptidase [Candidatus Dormibacter sp.]|uniref:aminopeptidase n=1 Tax=Candidatus Dormibacter sp. TaxID=2973982 RepID=UPI000DB06A54|nr:MAG: aminopeptidase [Candidatus Dormibacteraeota bacterium]